MGAFITGATRYSRWIFALVLLLTLPLGHFYGLQKMHNTIDVFFEKGDSDLAFYKEFQSIYGNEERSIILVEDDNIYSQETIAIIRDISAMANRLEGVRRVISITEQNLPTGKDDTVYFEPLIPSGPLTKSDLEAAHKRAQESELVDSLVLVSDDAKMSAIIVELESMDSNEAKGEIQKQLTESAAKIGGDVVELKFSGVPIIENELNTIGQLDNEKFGPITLLMVLIVVGFALRRVGLTVLCFANVVLVSIWSLGFYTAMGETLNLVTMMIPPVMVAISVADSIHFLAHYDNLSRSNEKSRWDNVREVIRVLWLPCLLTSATTIIGFLSFLTSPVRPVDIVGIYMSAGIAFAFILTFFFLPAALLFINKDNVVKFVRKDTHEPVSLGFLARFSEWLAKLAIARFRLIGLLSLILVVLIGIGVSKVGYVTNFTNYLPDDNKVKLDLTYIDNAYGGTVPIELLITAKDKEHDFSNPESIALIGGIQQAIMAHMTGDYTSSFSLADYFKSMHMAFHSGNQAFNKVPENKLDIMDYYEIGEPREIGALVSDDKLQARISFQCINGPFDINVRLESFTNDYLPSVLGDKYSYKFTGYGRLYVDMDRSLKETQIRSLVLAFVVVIIIMFLIAGNWRLAAITMIPNVFPIAMTLGLMGWLGIPFDVATIMVATMTLGIAVDDTIHYVTWFRRHRISGLGIDDALLATARSTGRPIILTSIVLFFGFLVMVFAQTLPLQFFGLLTAMTMIFALIGDLLLFPALIKLFLPDSVQEVNANSLSMANNAQV